MKRGVRHMPTSSLAALALLSLAMMRLQTAAAGDDDGRVDVWKERLKEERAAGSAPSLQKDRRGLSEYPEMDFVRVQGMQFVEGGKPFYFAGTNQYNLRQKGQDPNQAYLTINVLDDAKAMGLSVIRTWAFADGERWNTLQRSPGVYDEAAFVALDRVVSEAKVRGIRLLMPFINYWEEFGGVPQYVAWSNTAGSKKDFFYDVECQRIYKNWVQTLIMRRNTVTGILYRDEPAIFAWELGNEPRCPDDPSGQIHHAWVKRMSEFVKSIDGNHMLTVGSEGFWNPANPMPYDPSPSSRYTAAYHFLAAHEGEDPSDAPHKDVVPNWHKDGSEGTDFIKDHALPHIDFAACHMYLGDWGIAKEDYTTFAKQWLVTHLLASEDIRKPFVITEFGSARKDGEGLRMEIYETVFRAIAKSAGSRRTAGGSMFWILVGDKNYPDYDGYSIYKGVPEYRSTVQLIEEHATTMKSFMEEPESAPPSR